MYVWHTVVGMVLLFGLPAVLYGCSGFLESIWYVKPVNAVHVLTPDKGVLGIATGMMLGFGVSVPLAHWIIKGYVGADLMEIYDVWYDSHPNHPLNAEVLGRGLMWIFIPLALLIALYFRYDYTFVTQDALVYGDPWRMSEQNIPLQTIRAVEMHLGKIAPNGDYNPGFRYRLHFENHAPWESPFFSGSMESSHPPYRSMIDFVLQKTGLEMTELATPQQ